MIILPLWAALLVALLIGSLYAAMLCASWGRNFTTQKTHITTVIGTAQRLVLTSPTEAILLLGQVADKTVDGENILRQAKDNAP